MSRFSWNNEWTVNEAKENTFLVKHVMDKTPKWMNFIRKKVPKGLQRTLDVAFNKAFSTIFDKTAVIIEKTYDKDKQIEQFRYNKKQMNEENFNKKSIRRFERQAKKTVWKNLAISGMEGLAFGLLGMGIPDIPVFVSVMLKSLYEISLSYGFSYKSQREKLFILCVVEAALQSGNELREQDTWINELIDEYNEKDNHSVKNTDEAVEELKVSRQIDKTAGALSKQLLYWKFIQGQAVVGLVGGMADVSVLKRVTDYAILKYKRRFLLKYEHLAE